ncbi:uncharacterized protein LOC111700057 [Eurytemora carolleeae]|uniref:uncharacterized protein LOC111700057 n=1 Tax=Eurytemora carolleeae TaxID=1294199 RepID=UPI000C774E90|nr:uncharacterized protein LOC111700057 [Eurytemora carolleeae]|eukprot:XP_023326643.1 uncharacterized protein LOC111700057 [Eurytemora affinis]
MLLCKRYKMWFCKKVWKKENLLGLTLFICLLAVVGSKSNNSADIRTIVVDKGKNITISCGPEIEPRTLASDSSEGNETISDLGISEDNPEDGEWILPGRANLSGSLIKNHLGDLVLVKAQPEAEGVYTCYQSGRQYQVEVKVRKPPGRVLNLQTYSHPVYATVSWSVHQVGIQESARGFLCLYRNDTSQYTQVDEEDLSFLNSTVELGPNSRTCDLYNLTPNHTYFVKVAGYNSAGVGEFVSTILHTPSPPHTLHSVRLVVSTILHTPSPPYTLHSVRLVVSTILHTPSSSHLLHSARLVVSTILHTPSPSHTLHSARLVV